MAETHLTVYARSDVGRVRTNNEDAFLVSDLESGARLETPVLGVDVRDRGVLMVVSDGMGGHAAGEVASALVVESLRRSLSDPAADHSSLQRLIDTAVNRANAEVREAARATEKQDMGATLTAVLVHGPDAFIAEVGDSRGYLLRGGRLKQITKDQSFVQMLVDAGVLTPEQAKDSPQRNVILQSLGRDGQIQTSIGRLSLRHGDRLLLCSDGLSNLVSDAELARILDDPDISTSCDRMIDLANERGGEDNLTAVVALVEGDALPLPREEERPTQTLNVLQEFGKRSTSPDAAELPVAQERMGAHRGVATAPPAAFAPAARRSGGARQPWLLAMLAGLALAALLVWFFL
jgi:PPM family protein phosphatase